MYTRRKDISRRVEFSKIRRFSFELSTFPLCSTLATTTFLYRIKFAYIYRFVAYLFDADSTPGHASRNILSKNIRTRYFRNSIRSRIHLFNPRVTFTRELYSCNPSLSLVSDARYVEIENEKKFMPRENRVSRFSFIAIAFNREKRKKGIINSDR